MQRGDWREATDVITSRDMVMAEAQVKKDRTEPAPPRLRHRILQAGGWAGVGFVLDKAIAAIQLMVVARLLVPADFGVMAASATIVLAFMTISELGLESALIAKAKVDRDDLAVAWTVAIARGAAMAVCLWATAEMIGQAMQMPQLASLLRVHAWVLVLQGLQSPAMAIVLKNLDFRWRVTMDLVRRVIETGAIIILTLWLRNVWALLLGQMVGMCVGSLLSFWVAPFRPRLSLHRPACNYFLRYGKHLNVTTLCIFGVMSGGELVIGRLLGQEALGFYQIALAIPLLLGVRATVLIHQISMPTYALLQQDRLGVARVFELQMGLIGLIFIPLAVAVAVLAPVIVPLAFGSQWLAIVDPLRMLCVYAVCAGYSSVMTALHYGANRPDLQMKSWGAQFLFYALVIVPMTMGFGLTGAAAALVASYVVGVVLQSMWTRSLIGTAVNATFWSLGKSSLLAAVLAGVILLLSATATPPTTWVLISICLGGLGLYGWYLWSMEVPRLKVLWEHR
ncbi:MAG TPA: oligosaccharide flippase family protein [Nitrospiraceae bacterium]|nr:oligosaccharide flippase family protein [Nitrospiraceae bacterium]